MRISKLQVEPLRIEDQHATALNPFSPTIIPHARKRHNMYSSLNERGEQRYHLSLVSKVRLAYVAFTELLKLSVKKRAHFSCCLCHSLGVEVHHIIPQENDGPDTEDNAAPLCPSCHEIYGANRQKRKFIREGGISGTSCVRSVTPQTQTV